ncbi:bactofilin family protein [Ideonella margarita]|uniref:Polymer-forming cytoskeletal protein n=1 Tax=Ideonella margarita TaxID=2984191 RepID=A0ABU9BZU6_9BURK
MDSNPYASDPSDDEAVPDDPSADAPEVMMGQSMPEPHQLPTLQPAMQAMPVAVPEGPIRHSTLADGLSFSGTAAIAGSITVAGEVQGDLRVSEAVDGHVTVTETGTVVGDITARNISVLGQTVGLLDAGGGRVSLHSTASVSGRIRYTHLQVNGADLNAQLERVRTDGDQRH